MLKKTVVLCALALVLSMPALAQETAAAGGASGGVKWGVIGAAFLLGRRGGGRSHGPGKATSAASEGMSRNPGRPRTSAE